MEIEIITKADFQLFKTEVFNEMKKILQYSSSEQKEWLKTSDVIELLSCSPGTLQNLRINGSLPFSKMGGTIYYNRKDVFQLLNTNNSNAA